MREKVIADGIETVKLTTARTIRCGYGMSIKEGTEVNVTIETIKGKKSYKVAYPGSDTLLLAVSKNAFLKPDAKPIQTDLKVGDTIFFASIYSLCTWKDKIVKITDRYAYFQKHHSCKGSYRVELSNFKHPNNTISVDIHIEQSFKFPITNDRIYCSKVKTEIQYKLIELIRKLKIDKAKVISGIADEHAKKIAEYEDLQQSENKILKEIEKAVN